MKCNENGCNNEVTIETGFVPPLVDISAAAGKLAVNLTAEDLLTVAYCEECVALHEMCGDEIKLYSVQESLAEIARRQKQKAELANQLRLRAQQAQELALRKAAKSTLGAKLLGLGFKPTVSEFVHI